MRIIVAVAAFLAVAGTTALAQQKAPLAQQKAKVPAESVAFAKQAAGANTFELQSSKLAQERAQSSEVKSFAEQMIADHTKIGEDFKGAIQAANMAPPPEQLDAKQKAALSKLKNAQGPAFDRAYMSAQLAGHKQAAALLRKYGKTGRTPQLKEFAQRTLPTVEQHLAKVTDLNSRLVAAGPGKTGIGSRAIGPPADKAPHRGEKRH